GYGLVLFKPPSAASDGAGGSVEQPLEDRAIVDAASRARGLQDGPATLPRAPREAVYLTTPPSGGAAVVSDLLPLRTGAIQIVASGGVFAYSGGRFVKLEDP